ncbi:MAG: response regulator [Pseudomonadota bacterium]|nr:response regulator [Pseudomonadota bacterium]
MGQRLLVIDDQSGIARAVASVAASLGFDARALSDPQRALETFTEFRPDVVILDMIMPGKDGIDVLHEILLTGVPTRLVLASGLSASYVRLAEQVAKFHNAPSVAVLRKPFRRDDIIRVLQATPMQADPV